MWPVLLTWMPALVPAKFLMNPFVSAEEHLGESAEHGARRFPVELTMANDLPLRLAQPLRCHSMAPVQRSAYFRDRHAFPPEPGM